MGEGHRLRRRAEFQRVYAKGVKAVGALVVVFFLKGEGDSVRLGITATKRIGRAVVRNRARRRVRELVRREGDGLGGVGGDLVINLRQGAAGARWEELREDFFRCVNRIQRRIGCGQRQ